MTREEEIKCTSKDYINYLLDKQEYHNENYTEYDIQQAFEKGAMFVNNNLGISSLWHDASEEPKIGSNILVINKIGRWWNIRSHDDDFDCDWPGIKDWICCVRTYDIQKWAYIEDILPKN